MLSHTHVHEPEDEHRRQPMHHPTEAVEDASTIGGEEEERRGRYDGTWGERDSSPVDQRMAMEDYENLRRELTNLSKQRSGKSSRSISRTPTTATARRTRTGLSTATSELPDADNDVDPDEFQLGEFMEEGHFEKRVDGRSAKKVGVVYKNLSVEGVGAKSTFVKTLPQAIMGTFGPDLFHLILKFFPVLAPKSHKQTRNLIHDFTGVVRDGEMMLVLGRPGAGCSTFLKVIANNRDEYAEVNGEVSYGGIDAATQKKYYRGEVNYNPEDDVHMPALNVWQTFKFALLTKTKKRERYEIPIVIDALLKMFGIAHTKYTPVGNEYVPGVSGGERKRVSIAETLASKCTVLCWDNSTRGLDASTALDYARSLRVMTDVGDRTTLTTLYQAGQGIYDVMDKVLVIDQGRCIYQGPAKEARQYFIDLGFDAPPRQTTADFLTACTDPVERRFREGHEKSCPKTPDELEKAYRESKYYKQAVDEVAEYEREIESTGHRDANAFQQTVLESKSHRTVPKKSPYTVSFYQQVLACARREFWLLWGDMTTIYTKVFIIIANGLIVGSLFYGQSFNTSGAFSRGGSLFFSILFIGWLQLTELMKALQGRAVVERQKDYAFYRPSAVAVARVLVDLPVLFPQVAVFGIIMYFMSNLDVEAGKFFIYLLFAYLSAIMLTALYRMFAALSPSIDDAVRFSGISLNLLIIFTGYVIPKPQLLSDVIWFGWLFHINPVAYSFEAVVTNEFVGRTMECAPNSLVPNGPSAVEGNQGCAIAGSGVNGVSVTGADYLQSQFNYSRSHLWRNFGVVIAFTALYIFVTIFGIEFFNFNKAGGGALVFKKTSKSKKIAKEGLADEENAGKAVDSSASSDTSGGAQKEAMQTLSNSESIFTWEDVNYTVPTPAGDKQLLYNVSGYAKPGVMIALMGSSGAGKTTLLNTLSQRNFMGVTTGDMLVDGRPLSLEFQRTTGFCQQMDLHDGSATIREALEFSALLRQSRDIPRAEKIAYVDKVIDLLELNEMQDAIISSLGVEQRKRLTIGVELAAKPSLLLFLDEPTSGLDSQSAFSIVHFLRKLADAGQAILCTIHQPSSELIQQFDMILALNLGGSTFYFGPVGDKGSAVVKYFGDRGFDCPPEKNIAEFILETAAKVRRRPDGTKIDWNKEWADSQNAQDIRDEIDRMKEERSKAEGIKLNDQRAFAASTMTQTIELCRRLTRQYWRDPSYLYGKLFVSVIVGIFNGFTFWQLGNSIISFQDRMFSAFLIITLPPTIVNTIVPKFFTQMMLWQAREFPSRIYGWVAFTTAQVVCEFPIIIVQSVLYFVLWYFPAGLPTDSSTAGYVYLMSLLFFFFMSSWGQWITAFAPSFTVIANVLPFFFVMITLFNGIVQPYSSIPVFWRYWMYYINPTTWWLGGVLGATLHNVPVICNENETALFTAPGGQTCDEYTADFAQTAPGYLLQDNGDGLCRWCPYSVGDDYLSSLNIDADNKWRDFGIFLVFTFFNWFLVYFFIWSVRIKHYSFGLGYIFGPLGMIAGFVINNVKKIFARKDKAPDPEWTSKRSPPNGANKPAPTDVEKAEQTQRPTEEPNVQDSAAKM